MLTAVASSPGRVRRHRWVPLLRTLSAEMMDVVVSVHEVVEVRLELAAPIVPEPGDVVGCRSWAAGYLEGMKLDPSWPRDDHATVVLTAPILLSMMNLPEGLLEAAGPDYVARFARARADLGDAAVTIYRHFRPARRTARS